MLEDKHKDEVVRLVEAQLDGEDWETEMELSPDEFGFLMRLQRNVWPNNKRVGKAMERVLVLLHRRGLVPDCTCLDCDPPPSPGEKARRR